MLLQLLPQFFSLQHLSVNLLVIYGHGSPCESIVYSEFHTGAGPCDVSTGWESKMFPQISTQT